MPLDCHRLSASRTMSLQAAVMIQHWPVAFCDSNTDRQGWSPWSHVALRLLGPLGPQERQFESPQVQPRGPRQGYLRKLALRELGWHFCFPEMCIWIHPNTCSIRERAAEPRAVISCLCLNINKGGWCDGTSARGRIRDAETDWPVTEATLLLSLTLAPSSTCSCRVRTASPL